MAADRVGIHKTRILRTACTCSFLNIFSQQIKRHIPKNNSPRSLYVLNFQHLFTKDQKKYTKRGFLGISGGIGRGFIICQRQLGLEFMESRSKLAAPGVRAGSVRGPFGLRSVSVRGPFGVRSGFVRDLLKVLSGFVRCPFGVRLGINSLGN